MPVVHGVRVNARRAIAAALVGVAGAVSALMLVLSLAGSSDSIEVRLGDDDFRGIDATGLADEIADHGPVPFPDLLGRDRPIWVTHAGSDPVIGWHAFLARTPKGGKCVAQWDANASGDWDDDEKAAYRKELDRLLEERKESIQKAELDQQIASEREETSLPGTTGAQCSMHPINTVLEEVCSIFESCLLYTSPSPRDGLLSRIPSSA